MQKPAAALLLAVSFLTHSHTASAAEPHVDTKIFDKSNLVAWCIVPFDAKKRTPAERAEMLHELGLTRCAYDWRAEHVPTFEDEIREYQKHGIGMFAFWGAHEKAFELFEKYQLHPQIWQTAPSPPGNSDAEKIEAAAAALKPLAERTAKLGLPLGLYNHGGWGGEPANLVSVCRKLRELGYKQVGIVYNFHHGHGHIADWKESLPLLQPYLLCVNINGMNASGTPKILGLAKGEHELEMLRVLAGCGYKGPIGILDHRPELDARESLLENLQGLEWVQKELQQPGSGGPKPVSPSTTQLETASIRSQIARKETTSQGHLMPGKAGFRTPPITVECRASLHSRDRYNILVASDTKQSAAHWELFTMPRSGFLTAYLPGKTPDHIRTETMICDGQPHTIAMLYEPARVRLFVDGSEVADQPISVVREETTPGDLGIGRLVEGGLFCDGDIAWVRISQGVRALTPNDPVSVAADAATLGFWKLEHDPHTHSHGSHEHSASETPAAGTSLQPYDPEFVTELVSAVAESGLSQRGANVFANAKSACLQCHKIGSSGGSVGPELTAIGKQRDVRQLVESVFWPKRDVKPEFVSWSVMTTQGQVATGYKLRSDDQMVVLHNPAAGVTTELPRREIEEEVAIGTLMPEGLTAAMTRQQQVDLVRFLSELGRDDAATLPALEAAMHAARNHEPAKFAYNRAPIFPAEHPHADLPVNKYRLFDFYAKEAEYFRTHPPAPMLIADYPGLDGGDFGHWGVQTEADWSDLRWNDSDLGSLQCGVFRGGGATVARAVCVRLGEQRELSACFNPDTLTYDALWSGGFVSFSAVRHGFMNGITLQGQPLPLPKQQKPEQPFTYKGFYRAGNRVIFSYRIGETEFLDSPWVENGEFVRVVSPADQHPLLPLIKGTAAQWPQRFEKAIHFGDEHPYAIDRFELPYDNPWRSLLYFGGHDLLSTDKAVLCTMQGDVWQVSGLAGKPGTSATASWRRIASGLHHALGLVVNNEEIYVLGRDQITRLHDLNGDGEADFYECFSNAYQTSTAGHDFICGLERDPAGNFYIASGNQGLVRISPDGKQADVLATGFRNPDGLGLLPDGTVTVPCSEGEWTPASMICAVRPHMNSVPGTSPHFGQGGPRNGKPPELPMVYLPRGVDNSSGGQTYVSSDRWGPLEGQLLHFSFGTGTHFLILRDEVDGQLQGGIVPLPGDFQSGVHRGRFSPYDGQLYVSGMGGWTTFTPEDGCFQRIRYTGGPRQLPSAFHIHENGIAITFLEPLDATVAGETGSHFAQSWNYRYSAAYGSAELSPMHPGARGHDPLKIASAHVLEDGRTLFLELPDLQPTSVLHLWMHVDSSGHGQELFTTIHKLDRPFAGFPNYQPRAKTIAAHPLLTDMTLAAKRVPNPWRRPLKGSREIKIETGKNLTFATRQITAKAGEPIQFTLANPDVVPHNWALVKPGALQRVGELANRLIADPDAVIRHYVPESEDVLVYTDIVNPGEQFSVHFRAPSQPGKYPYLCTFPGHWMVMNGILVVE